MFSSSSFLFPYTQLQLISPKIALTSPSASKIQIPGTESAFELWLVQNKAEKKPLEENVFISREKEK